MSVEEIDDFFYKCQWIDAEKGDNKTLPHWRLKKIKNDLEFAEISISNLFEESNKDGFLDNVKNATEKTN